MIDSNLSWFSWFSREMNSSFRSKKFPAATLVSIPMGTNIASSYKALWIRKNHFSEYLAYAGPDLNLGKGLCIFSSSFPDSELLYWTVLIFHFSMACSENRRLVIELTRKRFCSTIMCFLSSQSCKKIHMSEPRSKACICEVSLVAD